MARAFTVAELCQALVVEFIRRLWHDGKYRDNKTLKAIHGTWFEVWVAWKTDLSMRDVDQQAEQLVESWENCDVPPIGRHQFLETLKGETPLGGEMRITSTIPTEKPDKQ